ncbi:MAG TPA: hypothetical protein VNZ64_10890 [Candidatus Acidoferrum sp.]|nr:hypothetical protein [Candidatus Acidoferrum sp.]
MLGLALAGGFLAGCASPNVNPAIPKANTGYVDFCTDSAKDLYWEVRQLNTATSQFEPVFSRLKPIEGGILRLAFAPGHHPLQVTFLNRFIAKPAEVEVEVQAGKITPVRVTLTEAGVTSVQTKETSRGGTVYGRPGRRTKFSSNEAAMYDISAVAAPPVAYEVKERMTYGP